MCYVAHKIIQTPAVAEALVTAAMDTDAEYDRIYLLLYAMA